MSSKSEIRFNFRKALYQAEQLDNLADRADKLAKDQMETSIQALASAWKGENATAFLKKEEQLKGEVSQSAAEIRSIAAEIRSIARNVYLAEMAALRIARKRRS